MQYLRLLYILTFFVQITSINGVMKWFNFKKDDKEDKEDCEPEIVTIRKTKVLPIAVPVYNKKRIYLVRTRKARKKYEDNEINRLNESDEENEKSDELDDRNGFKLENKNDIVRSLLDDKKRNERINLNERSDYFSEEATLTNQDLNWQKLNDKELSETSNDGENLDDGTDELIKNEFENDDEDIEELILNDDL